MPKTEPQRSRFSRWWRRSSVIVLGVIGLVIYAGVLLLYWYTTQPAPTPDFAIREQVFVEVSPTRVNPAEAQIQALVTVVPTADLWDDEIGLTHELKLTLYPINSGTITFDKGQRSLTTRVEFRTNRAFQNYPFDEYESMIMAEVVLPGAKAGSRSVPVRVGVWGDIPGWRVEPALDLPPTMLDEEMLAVMGSDVSGLGMLSVRRSGSTAAIVGLILLSMIVVAGTSIMVARAVATRRRRVEATMASWFAALLFALVPLRLNMPGSPPIGSWIDFTVFLWVMLTIMVTLTIFVWSWLRYTPKPDYAPPDPEPEAGQDEAGPAAEDDARV